MISASKERWGQHSTENTWMTLVFSFFCISKHNIFTFQYDHVLLCFESFTFNKYSAQVCLEHWFDHQPNDETAQQQKSGGKGGRECFGGGRGSLWGRRRSSRGENEVEIKWRMVWFTKNALCQSWKRIDQEKRKKERKERMKKWKTDKRSTTEQQRYITLYSISSSRGL